MNTTQFAMVEELASLVKDNLPCKHLILSMEEELVNFLQDDISLCGMLELKPMNPYYRLLVHRLADIFGFSHQSVGEGEDRHLILERSEETLIPSILVSDLLWQYDDVQSPTVFDVLKREEVLKGKREEVAIKTSLEDRETAYFAARERIFASDSCETKLVKQRPQQNLVVAHRMITRALGETNKMMMNHQLSSSDTNNKAYERATKDVKPQSDEGAIHSSNKLEKKFLSKSMTTQCTLSKAQGGSSATERKKNKIQENDLKKEHMGAAKRLFANALGIPRRDISVIKCEETKKTNG